MDHDNPWATSSPVDDDDDWHVQWATAPNPPDQWEAARRDKETLDNVAPPELLDAILHHCQQVSQEIWPLPETGSDDNWRSGFDNFADMTLTFSLSTALLVQLLPADQTLPPTVQFSATATSTAMNEALKLTRHLPASASSPLSRLLASRGALEWEKSIKAKQDVVLDTAPAGWRVLEKEDRLSTLEESKPRKGGLLSFWNRRASAIQAASAESPTERSNSPARSSLESVPRPPSSRAPSPPKPSTPSIPPPPPPPPDSYSTVVATAAVPSAVSRFLNRFSRAKGSQHSALALSSDDLEFLSDIVPSASDPPDEDINSGVLGAFTGASNSPPLPPKLPPPIPPPPRQSIQPGSSSALADSAVGNAPTACQAQSANQIPNVPVMAPPPSPKPAVFFSHTPSPSSSLKEVASPSVAFGQPNTLSTQQRLQPTSQPHSLALSPRQKVSPLSISPLLPPPPVSPQTPRPNIFPITTTPDHPSTLHSSNIPSFHDPYESDEEFTAFKSFPPPALAPFPSLDSRPPQRTPSPPSPPPRRTYERTHYPSSSSTSSILSPTSQSSADQLCPTKSSVSASLDSFDGFASPPPVMQGQNRKHTPSPPPLPVKSQSQHRQLPRIDIALPRVHHGHTPSQAFASPTAHTGLMTSVFSVSDTEHQRTKALVDHAAARGGSLWPNSPDSDEPRVKAIPPPLPSFASPKLSAGEECYDLLGGDTLDGGGGLEALRAPVSLAGSIGVDSAGALHTPFQVGVVSGPGKGLGLSNLQPSLPPTSVTPLLSFSSLGASAPSTATNIGSVQPTKPRQTGGLSAQDISFFEGL